MFMRQQKTNKKNEIFTFARNFDQFDFSYFNIAQLENKLIFCNQIQLLIFQFTFEDFFK